MIFGTVLIFLYQTLSHVLDDQVVKNVHQLERVYHSVQGQEMGCIQQKVNGIRQQRDGHVNPLKSAGRLINRSILQCEQLSSILIYHQPVLHPVEVCLLLLERCIL